MSFFDEPHFDDPKIAPTRSVETQQGYDPAKDPTAAGSHPVDLQALPDVDSLRSKLYSTRSNVLADMEDAEKSLMRDIEVAGSVIDIQPNQYPQRRTRFQATSPTRILESGSLCDVCGLNRDEASFCPITGTLHRTTTSRFEEVRKSLLRDASQPAKDFGTQTFVQPDTMATTNNYGIQLNVGGYCLVRSETEVRRQCSSGTAIWHDAMSKYCNGAAVGRIVFAKPNCSTADVTFPDKASWLFPVGALTPYKIPTSLSQMESFPAREDPLEDPHDNYFIQSLEQSLREREILNKISELRMQYTEHYIVIYKEEKTARKKLMLAFSELGQIVQLENHAIPAKPFNFNYPQMPRVEPAGPVPVPQHSRNPFADLTETYSRLPPSATNNNNTEDAWKVVGVTDKGHYIFRENSPGTSFPAPPSQLIHDAPPPSAQYIALEQKRDRQERHFIPKSLQRKESLL
eukprot:TRINITY_DN3393_c2_g1_i1.p1 TRINITY_DN3393_c2_g1~~TRINITY_DN3393_c2_g1_i1.p1  ORF type:complete len:473 (+),score=77.57 TRINITY_DN3393_c2_g1_i1:43-1419(+)